MEHRARCRNSQRGSHQRRIRTRAHDEPWKKRLVATLIAVRNRHVWLRNLKEVTKLLPPIAVFSAQDEQVLGAITKILHDLGVVFLVYLDLRLKIFRGNISGSSSVTNTV